MFSGLCAATTALVLLPSCGQDGSGERSAPTSASSPTTTSAARIAAPTPPGPAPKSWFDLDVGDCLTEIPAIDTGVVTADTVDCSMPHQAEVYLLAPLKVDTAIDSVAGDRCAKGLVDYTGRPSTGPFVVSYLIDSNQDRTADNPTPSTAICFLQAADGAPLTGSARR